jgi:signal transduction histidine kinase
MFVDKILTTGQFGFDIRSRRHKIINYLARFMMLSAALTLLGWFSRTTGLLRLDGMWPVVSISTAINFFFVGAFLEGLYLKTKFPEIYRKLKWVHLILLLWILLTSLFVFLQQIFHWSFVLESLFFPRLQMEIFGEFRRMSLSTALCFIFTAVVLVSNLFNLNNRKIKLSLNIISMLITGIVLVSYLYQTQVVYDFTFFKDMSVITASLFFIFHFIWFFSLIAEIIPFQLNSQDRPIYIGLGIIFISFTFLGIVSSRSLLSLIESHQAQVKIQEQIKDLQSFIVDLVNIETGARGYVLTQDENYLEAYRSRAGSLLSYFEQFKKNKSISTLQLSKLNEIEQLAGEKIRNIEKLIKIRQTSGLKRTADFVSLNSGKNIMDRVRLLVEDLSQEQLQILKNQSEENKQRAGVTLISLVGGTLVAASILIACFALYRKNEVQRIKAEAEIFSLNQILANKLKETENLNREMESFSYSVSHDLRAPLRAMSGFGHILLEDLSPKLEKNDIDYINRIVAASEKMSRLIDGILVLSRISRTQIKKQEILIQNMVETIVSDFESTEGKREMLIKFKPQQKVFADETLLSLLLQNLLGNSWKFTSKKTDPRIEIGSFLREGQEIFYIQDNGAGFDMKYIDKLFGTFQRLHFESDFQGTGIGLATSKRIVSLHGGEIWAEGIEGQGATFFFKIDDRGGRV